MRGRRRILVRIVTAARDPIFGGFFTRLWGLVLLRQGWGAYVTQVGAAFAREQFRQPCGVEYG